MSTRMNPFWRQKKLSELDREEWESLCDGCAKCCLYRLEDEDTRDIYFTNVHCRLLDTESGRCSDYPNRSTRVPDCVTITPAVLEDPYWLPQTCAYRLLAEGRDLPNWHPLVSGDPQTVVRAGQRVCGRTICEDDADELEQHLVDWVE
ncbi:MAG: YcgN family cysteine cluster protein [Gammaproteobacteria bacterium]|nr:YcgN family cysteine cluster protein [Gammaproteobacteria bacterium]MCP5435745.1 YcgN family cysteine cluster protein [Chromatiaceae bacterium]